MFLIKRSFLFVFLFAMLNLGTLAAQPQLNRISITERSDGNGYVIRYHLTEFIDSYDVIQPTPNRIQMQLFSPGLNAETVEMPEANAEIAEIGLIAIEGGIGVDIRIGGNVYFSAAAYPDQNQRDLLLNLEYANQAMADELAAESDPYDWSEGEPPTEPEQDDEIVEEPEEEEEGEEPATPRIQRTDGNAKVHFGFSGGLGISNKIGGGYTSEPRQEMTMGLTAFIDLPFILPYSVEPGIETGIFYTQKGLQNPSGGQISAQTVVLDYIEIPIMGKLRYTLTEIMNPYAVGGFYTAFRTAAETVQDDGDRGNIGDVTKNIDVGLIAGLGSDFVFEQATISLQARYGVGIPPMFKDGYSGAERPGYLSLLIGFQF